MPGNEELKMALTINRLLLGTLLICLASCVPEDDERCRNGFYFEMNTGCLKEIDTATDTEEDAEDDAGITDSGPGNSPTGLGVECETDAECAGYDADFCAHDPTAPGGPGACTIKDCAGIPDKCPDDLGLACCRFEAVGGYPSMCIPETEIANIGTFVGC